MSSPSPNNIPNRHSRELMNRLVPKQVIHSHPVTISGVISKNKPKSQISIVKKKQLPPLADKDEEIKQEDSCVSKKTGLTKNPITYIKLAKEGLDPRDYVYLYPTDIVEDSENPTNLRIINPKKASSEEFWTLSLKGFTYFNQKTADFVPLDVWLRSLDLFSRILTIPFFKYQRQWRHFNIWSRGVRREKILKAHSSLSADLFFAHPILRQSFLRIQKDLNQLKQLKLFAIQPGKIYSVYDFMSENMKHKDKVLHILETFNTSLVENVQIACESAMDNLSSPDADINQTANGSPLDNLIASYQRSLKTDSKTTYEAPTSLKYTNKASKRAVCQKLVRFIRMIDFLVIGTLREICNVSLLDFYSTFNALYNQGCKQLGVNTSQSSEIYVPEEYNRMYQIIKTKAMESFVTPIFNVELLYDGTLLYSPKSKSIIERIDNVRGIFVQTLFSVPRLINNPSFKHYIEFEYENDKSGGERLSIPDISQIIKSGIIYKEVVKKQSDLIHRNFELLKRFSSVFDQSIQIYQNNQKFSIGQLFVESVSANIIRDEIKKFNNQESVLETLIENQNVGMFECHMSQMKSLFITSPGQCKNRIFNEIPHITRRYLTEFSVKVRNAHKELTITTDSVASFVQYLLAVQVHTNSSNELRISSDAIKDFHQLSKDLNIEISNDEQLEYQELVPVFDEVKRCLAFADDHKANLLPKFSLLLEKSISQLHSRVIEVVLLSSNPLLSDLNTKTEDAAHILNDLSLKSEEVEQISQQYNHYQKIIGLPITPFDDVDQLVDNVYLKNLLWTTKQNWLEITTKWYTMPFISLESDHIVGTINDFLDKATTVYKGLNNNEVADSLYHQVHDFAALIPVISDLKNPALRQVHIDQIEKILGDKLFGDPEFPFGKLVDLKAYNYVDRIAAISDQATNEQALLDQLTSVKFAVESAIFIVTSSKVYKNVFVIDGLDEISNHIDDAYSILSIVRSSKYISQHRARAEEWAKSLKLFSLVIHSIEKVQRSWTFLTDVFVGSEIGRQLSNDSKELANVEKQWKSFTQRVSDDPIAFKLCSASTLNEMEFANNSLEKIRKNVEQFLDSKKISFPRLFFLSNNEIISLFSKNREPHAIQPFLNRLFTGINSIEVCFENHIPSIISVLSIEGERIPLRTIKYRNSMETWMANLLETTQKSIKTEIRTAQSKFNDIVFEDWMQLYSCQSVLVALSISTSNAIQEAFISNNCINRLTEIKEANELRVSGLIKNTHLELNPIERMKTQLVLILLLDQLDLLNTLLTKQIIIESDIEWTNHIHYRWNDISKELHVVYNDFSFEYGYEYIGFSPRFITSPSFSKAIRSVIFGLAGKFGTGLIGSSNSGKSEIMNHLSSLFGRFSYSYICTETTPLLSLINCLRGAIQSGAWIVFDKVGSIKNEVISIVGQQIYSFHLAQISNSKKFEIDGIEVPLLNGSSVFLTSDNLIEYTASLPSHMKRYFRQINLYEPELVTIAEVYLFIYGFESADMLSNKLGLFIRMCESILSANYKPSLGLRFVSSITLSASQLIHVEGETEEGALLSAIDFYVKSTFPECFQNSIRIILDSIFVHNPISSKRDIDDDIFSKSCNKHGVTPNEHIRDKIEAIIQTLRSRRGLLIYGEEVSGKSTLIRIAEEIINNENLPNDTPFVNSIVVFPSVHSHNDLFGHFLADGTWSHGVLEATFTKLIEQGKENWVIIDGIIEKNWSEQIVSCLDDNRTISFDSLLCFSISNTVKLVFESTDIAQASPSFISRCNLVHHTYSSDCLNNFIHNQIDTKILPAIPNVDSYKQLLAELVDNSLMNGISFYQTHSIGLSVFGLLDSFFSNFCILLASVSFNERDATNFLTSLYAYSYIWAFGGPLQKEHRKEFETVFRMVFHSNIIPSKGSIYDYIILPDSYHWTPVLDVLPKVDELGIDSCYKMSDDFNAECFIPTMESYRDYYVIKQMIKSKRSLFISGENSCGKSVLVKKALLDLSQSEAITYVTMCFSPIVPTSSLYSFFKRKLEKKHGKILQPPGGKFCAFILEDYLYPSNSVTQEFTRSILSGNGIRLSPGYKSFPVKNASVIGISSLTFKDISPRLSRYGNCFSISYPDPVSIITIISSFLSLYFSKQDEMFKKSIQRIIQGQMAIFTSLCEQFPPRIARPHYYFRHNQLFQVMRSVSLLPKGYFKSSHELEKYIIYETIGSFFYRLIDDSERKSLEDHINPLFKKYFSTDISITSFLKTQWTDLSLYTEGLYSVRLTEFTDNHDLSLSISPLLDQYSQLQKFYNNHLIEFPSFSNHIARVVRCLKQPYGHIILLGNSSSGKRTCARVSSYICGFDVYESDNPKSVREDIKGLMIRSGVSGKRIAVVLTQDHLQIDNVAFEVNAILSQNYFHMLLTTEESDKICNDLAFYAKTIGENESQQNLQRLFCERVSNLFRIIIAISPISPLFSDMFSRIPFLNKIRIEYFSSFDDISLTLISQKLFNQIEISSALRDNLSQSSIFLYHTIKEAAEKMKLKDGLSYFVSPSILISFISCLINQYNKAKSQHLQIKDKIEGSLGKTGFAREFIETTESQLLSLRPQHDGKTSEAEQLIHYINENQETLDKFSIKVKSEEEEVQKQADEVSQMTRAAQSELDLVLPQLNNAIAQLKALNRGDIMDLRSFGEPPMVVRTVMEVVCILAEVDSGWKSAVTLLSDPMFINKITSRYSEGRHVPHTILKRIQPYVDSNPNFQEGEVGRISVAAKSLCVWSTALYNYESTFLRIEPKQQAIQTANNSLRKAKERLRKKYEESKLLEETIEDLKQRYEQASKERRKLYETILKAESQLEHAKKILSILSKEELRWKTIKDELPMNESLLLGNSFLVSCYLVFFGPLSNVYREYVYQKVHKFLSSNSIPVSASFSFVDYFANSCQIRNWISQGFPNENFSIENFIILTNSPISPFILDPYGIATAFINVFENQKQLSVLNYSQSNYIRTIESSIRLGIPVLIEDCGDILDSSLENVSAHRVYNQDGKQYIRLGDRSVECDDNFALYFVTSSYPVNTDSSVFSCCNVINFVLSIESLKYAILHQFLPILSPEVYKEFQTSVFDLNNTEKSIKSVEDKLIDLMKNSPNDQLLEDDIFISTLENSSNIKSELIIRRQKELLSYKESQQSINVYQPVAERLAIIVSVMNQLSRINASYRFSWQQVLSMANISNIDMKNEEEIDSIIKRLTYEIFSVVTRSLDKTHIVTFSFLLSCELMLRTKKLKSEDYMLFIHPPMFSTILMANPIPRVINSNSWNTLCSISNTSIAFRSIPSLITKFCSLVEEWILTNKEGIPPQISDSLNDFQKIILCLYIYPLYLPFMIDTFISQSLGVEYVTMIPFDRNYVLPIISNQIPHLVITSESAPILQYTKNLLTQSKSSSKLISCSLSQGLSNVFIDKVIRAAMNRGDWVLVENAHNSFSAINDVMSLLQKGDGNKEFRFIISAMTFAKYPSKIIRQSVKSYIGKSIDLKQSLLFFLDLLSEDYFSNLHAIQLTYSLTLFHCILNYRHFLTKGTKSFVAYWDEYDFLSASEIIFPYLAGELDIQYESLRYSLSLLYSGKTTTSQEFLVIDLLLSLIINQDAFITSNNFLNSSAFPVPNVDNRLSLMQYIKSLPETDNPMNFALSPSFNKFKLKCRFDSIKGWISQPKYSMDSVLMKIKQYLGNIQGLELKPETQKEHPKDFLDNFILNDFSIILDCIDKARNDMIDISHVMQGKRISTRNIESLITSISFGLTPKTWSSSYGEFVDEWISNILASYENHINWIQTGLPSAIPINHIADPKALIATMMIKFAQISRCQLDMIVLEALFTDIVEPEGESFYISNVSLSGAKWDGAINSLADTASNSLCNPNLNLKVRIAIFDIERHENCSSIPLYRRIDGKYEYITTFLFFSDKEEAFWVLRETALFI